METVEIDLKALLLHLFEVFNAVVFFVGNVKKNRLIHLKKQIVDFF